MIAVAAPMKIRIICEGKRKNGSRCGYVFVIGSIEQFEGQLEFACPKCHERTVFK